jgi:hypothetical protein
VFFFGHVRATSFKKWLPPHFLPTLLCKKVVLSPDHWTFSMPIIFYLVSIRFKDDFVATAG